MKSPTISSSIKIKNLLFVFLFISSSLFAASKHTEQIGADEEINLGTLVYRIIREEAERISTMNHPVWFAKENYKKSPQTLALWERLGGYEGLQARYMSLQLLSKGAWPFELTSSIKVQQGTFYSTGEDVSKLYKYELMDSLGRFDLYMSRAHATSCYVSKIASKIAKMFLDKSPNELELESEVRKIVSKDLFDFLLKQKPLETDKLYISYLPPQECKILIDSPITVANHGISQGESLSGNNGQNAQVGFGVSTGTSQSSSVQFFGNVGQKVMCKNGGLNYNGNDFSIYLNNCFAKFGEGVKVSCDTGTVFDSDAQIFCNKKIMLKINNNASKEYIKLN